MKVTRVLPLFAGSILALATQAHAMKTTAEAAHSMHPKAAHNYVGWVWGNEPDATTSYTPETEYSYNSQGGSIAIVPLSTGVYRVEFAGLYSGQPDDVQVSAYETSGYCVSNGWGNSGSTVTADVACSDLNGNPTNSYFTLLYQARLGDFGTPKKGIAYLWADEPSEASYTPDLQLQYNSTGALNSIVRNSTGNYTITIPGLDSTESDVQVTAYGIAARCNAVNWTGSASSTEINIQCFNSSGVAADEYYEVAYAVKAPFGYTNVEDSKGAWAWANEDTETSTYTPEKQYQYNGFKTGELTAEEVSTGEYEVTIPGSLTYNTSHVLVTTYNSENDHCNIINWGATTIDVACWDQGGNPVDSEFDVTFQTAE